MVPNRAAASVWARLSPNKSRKRGDVELSRDLPRTAQLLTFALVCVLADAAPCRPEQQLQLCCPFTHMLGVLRDD